MADAHTEAAIWAERTPYTADELLAGYKDAPADVTVSPGLNYNPYFPGGLIAMAPPLKADLVTFDDGTKRHGT